MLPHFPDGCMVLIMSCADFVRRRFRHEMSAAQTSACVVPLSFMLEGVKFGGMVRSMVSGSGLEAPDWTSQSVFLFP